MNSYFTLSLIEPTRDKLAEVYNYLSSIDNSCPSFISEVALSGDWYNPTVTDNDFEKMAQELHVSGRFVFEDYDTDMWGDERIPIITCYKYFGNKFKFMSQGMADTIFEIYHMNQQDLDYVFREVKSIRNKRLLT